VKSAARLLVFLAAPATLVALTGLAAPATPAAPPGAAVRLTHGAAPSLLSYNFARAVAVDEIGTVHAVWYDGAAGRTRVRHRRSPDEGLGWEPASVLSAPLAVAAHPAVAASGSDVYAVWHELTRLGPQIRFRRSLDRGATWEPSRALSGRRSSAHASVAAVGSTVHVVWGDTRDGQAEIYYRRSLDGGAHWEPERRLSAVPFESWVPTVAAEGERVVVAWVDLRDGNEEEYCRISDDGGATFGRARRLTADAADSWAPSVALADGAIHIAWFDRRDAGVSHTDVEASLDAALAFLGLPPEPRPPADPRLYYLPLFEARVQEKVRRIQTAAPAWVAHGGDAAALEDHLRRFESLMRAWVVGWEIYYKGSADGGATWTPDRRLTRAPGLSLRPSLAVAGNDVAIVWWDGRHGDTEVYAKTSSDAGATWTPDVRLTRAPGLSEHPSLALRRGLLHVLWHDTRAGNAEIYYRRLPLGLLQ
jgi:hypothetical protein